MVFNENWKMIRKISALPPPHPKQQSTAVFFKFKQVTHPRDWVIMKMMVTMVMIDVMMVMD